MAASQCQVDHLLNEGLESLGSYREFYRDLPAQICLSPEHSKSSIETSSHSTMTPPITIPITPPTITRKIMSKQVHAPSPTTTLITMASSFASTASSLQSPSLVRNKTVKSLSVEVCLPQEVSVMSSSISSTASLESSCDHMQVTVRLRPSKPFDRAWQSSGSVLQQRNSQSPRNCSYSFDHVLNEQASNAETYRKVARPIVDAVSQGKHGTVFAYGMTSSGKTHTMQGTSQEAGIIELAATDLFNWISEKDCTIKVQYFEIYNEQVRDLLVSAESPRKTSSSSWRSDLSVREDAKGNIVVNAFKQEVDSVDSVLQVLLQGKRNRATSATSMNANSSRSHAIYRLIIEHHGKGEESVDRDIVSVLNLVDLAGSENCAAAAAVGTQKREGGKINQSLLALSRVVHALSLPENKRPQHISYRDSKLTRILQQHLQGNAAVSVLCCVSVSRRYVEETKSTLQFAANAKRIILRPAVNEVVAENNMLTKLQQELAETKEALIKLQQEHVKTNDDYELYDELSTTSAEAVFGESVSEPDELWSESVRSFVSAVKPEAPPPVPVVVIRRKKSLPAVDLIARSSARVIVQEQETEQRRVNRFLEDRLLASDAMASTLFKNLRRYEELERLNKDDVGSIDDVELMLQHSLLLRVAFFTCVVLLYNGLTELFIAVVGFLWLSLEVATC